MQIKRCSNPSCRRPFQVNEFSSKIFWRRKAAQLICPHCGHTEDSGSASTFLVHALSPEEEAKFNHDNPL